MYIPLNAKVGCFDGDFGRSMYIIINPAIPQVTHLVVKKTELPQREILVPIDWVFSTAMGLIRLDYSREELEEQETFIKGQFIKACGSDNIIFWLNSHYDSTPGTRPPIEYKFSPPGRLIMHRRTYVEATDGCAGCLDELVINPDDGVITHVVLGKGHFLGKKAVTVLISQVDRLEVDTVYLKLDKRDIETLPSIKVWRRLLWDKNRPKPTNKVSIQNDQSSPKILYIHPSKNKFH